MWLHIKSSTQGGEYFHIWKDFPDCDWAFNWAFKKGNKEDKINVIKQKGSGQESLTFLGDNGKANNTITLYLVKSHDFEFPTSFDSWWRIVVEQLLY